LQNAKVLAFEEEQSPSNAHNQNVQIEMEATHCANEDTSVQVMESTLQTLQNTSLKFSIFIQCEWTKIKKSILASNINMLFSSCKHHVSHSHDLYIVAVSNVCSHAHCFKWHGKFSSETSCNKLYYYK
jgi:hypothetical protein